MAENQNAGRVLLKASDFVDVVNEEDEVVGSVPKHWGADQLPPGTRKKSGGSRSSSTKSGGDSSSSGSGGDSGGQSDEPAGNASTEEWATYAREVKGATDEDLVDADGKPLGRDALRDKFGTPTS